MRQTRTFGPYVPPPAGWSPDVSQTVLYGLDAENRVLFAFGKAEAWYFYYVN